MLAAAAALAVACSDSDATTDEALSDQALTESVFEEGRTYDVKVGWRDLMGPAKLRKHGTKYELTVRPVFVGAGYFSRTTPAEVKQVFGVEPDAAYFGTGATSFTEIPGLEQRLLEVLEVVRGVYRTDEFTLVIDPIFADDATFVSEEDLSQRDYRSYQQALNEGVSAARRDGTLEGPPIFVTALPDPMVMTPNLWDVYSNPLLVAHEFGHLMGILMEGYELQDYPPMGIMNAEPNFTALEKLAPGTRVRMVPTDFSELMHAMALSARLPATGDELDEAFGAPDVFWDSVYQDPDYWHMTPQQRVTEAEKLVTQWIANGKPSPTRHDR